MSAPRFALAITHAPWIPERVASMARLRLQLGTTWNPAFEPCAPVPRELMAYREETTRCPGAFWVWAELQWRWALDRCSVSPPGDATHAVFLQDDVEAAPDFWPVLAAMVEGRPHDVISFSCAHPAARTVAEAGAPGFTTCDGLIGIGYVIPAAVLADFMRWRVEELVPGAIERTTEDCLLGLFCMARGLRIFHPVPTIIDHDLGVASTNEGHDSHIYRAPACTFRDFDRLPLYHGRSVSALWTDPAWWARPVEHVGRFYETLHSQLPLVLRDVAAGERLLEVYAADRCPPNHRRFFLRARS